MFKSNWLKLSSLLLTITFVFVVCGHSVSAEEQSDQTLYSYFMNVFSKDYVDVSGSKKKLADLQKEYNIAVQNNLQVDSFEALKDYATTVEYEMNYNIDSQVDELLLEQSKVTKEVEDNLSTLSVEDLSKMSRTYYKYQEDIDSLLEDKTSFSLLFQNSLYERIDTENIELSIEEQQQIIGLGSPADNSYLGSLSKLKYPFEAPVRVTSHAGYRTDPIKGDIRFHNGCDFGMKVGTKIYALFDGVVVRSDNIGDGYGESIKVDCGNGIVVHYAHLSKRNVNVGDFVKQGDVIALSGNTGRSTGPHLHLGLFYYGEVLDVTRLFE